MLEEGIYMNSIYGRRTNVLGVGNFKTNSAYYVIAEHCMFYVNAELWLYYSGFRREFNA